MAGRAEYSEAWRNLPAEGVLAFGEFELDVGAGQLYKDGRPVRLAPQPFKLLVLLTGRAGALVTRDQIRRTLWSDDTFVDFDQAVSFAVRQVREALRDEAERPVYIQTVPRRGYRFIAPVKIARSTSPKSGVDTRLQRAIWENIADLRMAEVRRRRWLGVAIGLLVVALLLLLVLILRT